MLHFTILRSYRWPVLLACVIKQDCIILRHHHFRPPIRPLIWLSAESRMCLFLRFRPNFFGCRIFGAPLAKIYFILTRRGHLTPSTAVLVLKIDSSSQRSENLHFPILSNYFELTEANSRSGYKPPDVSARCSSVNCPVLERRSPSRQKESQGVATQIFGLNLA